jgi:cell division protein FtsI (penicillin-binding protein 3)
MDPYSTVPEIRRLRWLVRGAALWALIIFARLVHLQVVKHRELDRAADSQHLRAIEISAPRGAILDRSGQPLALSIPVDSLAINPRKIKDPNLVAETLSRTVELSEEELTRQLAWLFRNQPGALARAGAELRGKSLTQRLEKLIRLAQEHRRGFLWIKRRLTPAEASSLRSLARTADWIDLRQDSRRDYPHRQLAASVLGFVATVDGQETGAAGIELALNDELEGAPGAVNLLSDVHHRGLDELDTTPPAPGANVALTIDARIQHVADTALAAAVKERNCQSGSLVVMDPHSGDILAMSSYPTFDPNLPLRDKHELASRLNRNITVVYDPGSVLKLFTLAAALETTRLRATTPIACGNGLFRFPGGIIHDTKAYGTIPLEQVIWKSSNVGAIMAGIEVGRERLYQYLRNFGFGARTGILLPAESPGDLKHPSRWTPGSLYYISYGHELSVTTLQLAQAASVFANGGYRVTPRIVRWRERDGHRILEPPARKTRVIKPETAVEVRRISEGVVLFGTGKAAKLDGYTSGGKTGTAKIYSHQVKDYISRYNASYLGYAPLQHPDIVVVVTLDDASQFGGVVAAPVFKEVAQAALRIRGIEPDVPLAPSAPHETPSPAPAAPPALLASSAPPPAPLPEPPPAPSSHEVIIGPGLPDFSGMSKREVSQAAAHLNVHLEFIGKGIARSQSPPPGSPVSSGGKVRVYFAR